MDVVAITPSKRHSLNHIAQQLLLLLLPLIVSSSSLSSCRLMDVVGMNATLRGCVGVVNVHMNSRAFDNSRRRHRVRNLA